MTTPQLIVGAAYRPDGAAVVRVGQTVILDLRLEELGGELQTLTGRFFAQRILGRDEAELAEIESQPIDAETVRFTYVVSADLLPPGAKSADLRHVVVEMLEGGEDDILDRPFAVRTLRPGLPTSELTVEPSADRVTVRYVGAPGLDGASAAQMLIDAGEDLPDGSAGAFRDWVNDKVTDSVEESLSAPAVLSLIGVTRTRGFVAGADNTEQLLAALEGDAGEWTLPAASLAEPFLIHEQLPAVVASNKKITARGAVFKRAFIPNPEAPASLVEIASGTKDFTWDGGTFDFDEPTIPDLSIDLATNRWAAITVLDGENITLGVRALNVPGLAVYAKGGSNVNVAVRSEGCTAAMIYEEIVGGTLQWHAKDNKNWFGGSRFANFNGQVLLLRECDGLEIRPSWIDGVTGKKNPNFNPTSGAAWSIFYSGLTALNVKRSVFVRPLLTGMVNDQPLDADCLNFLAMSFVGEDLDILSPRVDSECNLAIELMTAEGGLNISNLYVDQRYGQSRISTQTQGVVWKGGGSEEPPDRAGRISTPGRMSIMNGGVVRRTRGDAFRFRNPGMQLSGTLIADAPSGYGFNFDHLDKTSSGMLSGHLPRAERDYAAPRLIALNPGKTAIAVNCGERLDLINCQGTGAGWAAISRENASGVGHPEQSDTETGAGIVSVSIQGGNYRGAPNETIAKAVSFVPGPPSELIPHTGWPMQKLLRATDMRMGKIGAMFRIRDVLGPGIDTLCRVIDQDGDRFTVAYEPLQELTGTCTFSGSTLTGNGSLFLAELAPNQKIYWPNGVYQEIQSIESNTSATVKVIPSMTGSITVPRKVERVLTASPDWTDVGFLTPISGTVSMTAGNKTINGHGSNFDGDVLGPCWIRVGADYLAIRIINSDILMSCYAPGAAVTVTQASNTGASMVLADIETFDPMHHSIRFDDPFTASLQLLDPKTGNTINDAVVVPLNKIDGPSRFVLETRKDYAAGAAVNQDVLTLPAGFIPLGVSAIAHSALTGATNPTSLDFFITDTSNVVAGVAVASLAASGGVIPAGATGKGHWPPSTAVPSGGWKLRSTRVGGSLSFAAGVYEADLLVAYNVPPPPLARGTQF